MEQFVKIKNKKAALGFVLFLLFMWICTLISKSVYASGLLQVSVQEPERKRIEHIVEAEGMIKQGGAAAVTAMAGVRVKKVHVRSGDVIEEGSLLFTLDKENLEEMIEAKKLEAAKLEYQISQQKENKALAEAKKQIEEKRSEEDYVRTEGKADTALNRAGEAYNKTAAELDEHLKNEAAVTSQEERQKAYDEYEKWLDENGQPTVSGNQPEKPDYSQEDSDRKAWEAEKKSLEENLKNAFYNKEDADTAKMDNLLGAGRGKEDASMPESADYTQKIYELELQALQKDIQKYREIYREDGKVKSEINGTVTGINLSPGERTPDGAAIICADHDVPLQFETSITKEQKKYVNKGDKVDVKTTGGREQLIIDHIEEEVNNPGSYRIVVYLPGNSGQLGMSGTMNKSEVSESYDCCIPADALHSEDNGRRHYIYLAGERDGILGKEFYAEQRYVNVLDRNDDYAALESGSVPDGMKVITAADREIERNEVIRLKE